jgi:hypothetical protein
MYISRSVANAEEPFGGCFEHARLVRIPIQEFEKLLTCEKTEPESFDWKQWHTSLGPDHFFKILGERPDPLFDPSITERRERMSTASGACYYAKNDLNVDHILYKTKSLLTVKGKKILCSFPENSKTISRENIVQREYGKEFELRHYALNPFTVNGDMLQVKGYCLWWVSALNNTITDCLFRDTHDYVPRQLAGARRTKQVLQCVGSKARKLVYDGYENFSNIVEFPCLENENEGLPWGRPGIGYPSDPRQSVTSVLFISNGIRISRFSSHILQHITEKKYSNFFNVLCDLRGVSQNQARLHMPKPLRINLFFSGRLCHTYDKDASVKAYLAHARNVSSILFKEDSVATQSVVRCVYLPNVYPLSENSSSADFGRPVVVDDSAESISMSDGSTPRPTRKRKSDAEVDPFWFFFNKSKNLRPTLPTTEDEDESEVQACENLLNMIHPVYE